MKFFNGEIGQEEDEEVVKGRYLCAGEYLTLIGMYPILTKEEYKFSFAKIAVFCAFSFCAPFHLDSFRWAIKAGEVDVCIENVAFYSMIASQQVIYLIFLLKRKIVCGMFRKVGSGFFKYSEPLTTEQQEVFDNSTFRLLFRANRDLALVACLFYFILVPTLKIQSTGSWSTAQGIEGEYPYNKNLPVRLWSPDTSNATSFLAVSCVLFVMIVLGALLMPCTSNAFFGFSVQIWNQIRVLQLSLMNVGERARSLYKERGHSLSPELFDRKEYKKCLSFCLRENIRHHIEIIKFYKSFDSIWAGWTCFQLLLFGTIISLTTYNILHLDTSHGILTLAASASGKFMLLSMNVLHVTIYCMAGQRTTDLSGDLHEAYYFNNWNESESPEFKQLVLQALTYSRKPFIVKGFGLVAAQAGTLVDVLKTAFSLLSFVKFVIG